MSQRASPVAQRTRRPAFESFEQALACHAQGRLGEAEELYRRVLEADERHFGAVHGLGLIRLQQGRFADAVNLFRRAIKIDRNSAEAHHHLGVALTGLGRAEDAVERFEKALAIRPDFAEAHDSLGHTLQVLGRTDAAIAHHERAIAIKPDYAEARNNLGNALQKLGRSDKAIAQYEKALAVRPDYAEVHNNVGRALASLRRHEQAIVHYGRALALRPDYADVCINIGSSLWALGRGEEAVAQYDRALTIHPDHVEALIKRGNVLAMLKRHEEALASFERTLAADPNNAYAFSGLANSAIIACDWTRTAKLSAELLARAGKGRLAISPFTFLGYCSDAALQSACAKSWIRHEIPVVPSPLWKGEIWRSQKIRVAYLSADFRAHATAYLIAELLELHDRSRFEVFGVSFGSDDHSEIRGRIVRAFDHFHDVSSSSDRDAAIFINDTKIDIALDLSAQLAGARPEIFALRPAPIQVNYLVSPGTLGADFIDYVIADPIVLPFDQQAFFNEKIVHLPECYQVNDSKRPIAERTPTRQESGLPAEGFVFCCFNNNYKITREIFEIWMRLLLRVDGSVLWLLRDNAAAEANLRKEAAARGVDAARLIFAGRLKLEEHLARHRLADLFLDTLPYNAHTTASDALWTGLPVVTCRGKSFPGRVAASLLVAAGLPELVTETLQDYEAVALRMATEPDLLAGFRERLSQNRRTCPLFNTDRFRRHMESAYTRMWELWQRGERPRSFRVEARATIA